MVRWNGVGIPTHCGEITKSGSYCMHPGLTLFELGTDAVLPCGRHRTDADREIESWIQQAFEHGRKQAELEAESQIAALNREIETLRGTLLGTGSI